MAYQVELWLVDGSQPNIIRGEMTFDLDKDRLCVLGDEETLIDLYTHNVTNCGLVNSRRPLFREKKLLHKYLQGNKIKQNKFLS